MKSTKTQNTKCSFVLTSLKIMPFSIVFTNQVSLNNSLVGNKPFSISVLLVWEFEAKTSFVPFLNGFKTTSDFRCDVKTKAIYRRCKVRFRCD